MMHVTLLLLSLSLSLAAAIIVQKDDAKEQARKLVANLTLDEKIQLVHGVRGPYVGNIPGIPRLSIPPLALNDGPQGFRGETGTSTAWPCALSMAATWDRELVSQWGQAMAKEFVDKGANVFLGPGVNVIRLPRNGRNFEYLSGEDPVLGSILVAHEIRGLQETGIIATVKHYVHNNQEQDRTQVNAIVDERTHWELYMPPFAAAVQAGVLSVMCSYNKVNGVYACQNNSTLNKDLKGILGFEGFVVSDWLATHSTVPAAMSGLDMEMPYGLHFKFQLKHAVQTNKVPMARLDDMVGRLLYAMIRSGTLKRKAHGTIHTNVTSEEHNQLARELAAAGVVLLKNEGNILPLSGNQSVLVMGDIIPCGNGSGHVKPAYTISGYEGIEKKTTKSVYYSSMNQPDYSKMKQVDKIVIFTSTTSDEGFDRKNLSFPDQELKVINHVIRKAPQKVIVVGTAPGAVLLPFVDRVPAVLLSFMPGQEAGNAIADILFGTVHPSGKLPLTLPNKDNEMEFTEAQYPGINYNANYSEQLLTGYRWYDAYQVKPQFAFGFGLSYTTFRYSELTVEDSYSFRVTNTGKRDGYEIAQVYLSFPQEAGEPPKLLKDFQKVYLKAGETKTVDFELSAQDLSTWSVETHRWEPVRGSIVVAVGPSSDNLPLAGTIHLGNANVATA